MSALHFSLQPNPSRDYKGHPLSTEPKSLKSQQGSDVLSSETETQHPPTGHSYTPLLQQSTHTMGTFFGWKDRRGWVAVLGGGWRVGVWGWVGGENRTRGWQCCSECVSFFGVEQEGTAEGQSRGLCVRHFECRLCYTVHGSPRVQRERVIYFVDIMNVGFVFGSSRTRMFSLISPHRGWEVGFYFGHMETMGSITL